MSELKKTADKLISFAVNYFTQKNPGAEITGLFLLFSSVAVIKGIRNDPQIRPTDIWQDFCRFNDAEFIIRGIIYSVILICVAEKLLKKFRFSRSALDGIILVAGVMMFGVTSLWKNENTLHTIAVSTICILVILVFFRYEDMTFIKRIPKRLPFILTLIIAALMSGFIITVSFSRHNAFCSSTYDLGIFVQMYHSMITNFTQITTCEREEVLSHFAVHFSPVYYLLLPVYFIWPSAKTLLAAQGIIVMTGAIPLYLICINRKMSEIMSMLFSIVYIFSAAIISPCFYDFHENMFLPPFLMWLFYSIEKENRALMYVMVTLTLMIKEDAALYLLSISLYMIFSRRSLKHGIIMFVYSGAAFVAVLKFMSVYGEGAMISRTFGNIMDNYDGGFTEIFKTFLLNPVYFICECFTEEKLKFIIIMLIPFLFTPFVTHRFSVMFLALPFIVLNLISGYTYSCDINFQYVFGTSVCLIYAALINVSEFKADTFRRVVPLMAAVSVLVFTATDTTRLVYCDMYRDNKEDYNRKEAYLDYIPEDASLLCSTFLLPHAANRDNVYMADEYNYSERTADYDFVAIEKDSSIWKNELCQSFVSRGYTVYAEYESLIVIYKSPYYESESINNKA